MKTKIYTIKWNTGEQTINKICKTCWQETLDDMIDDIVSWSEAEGDNDCEFCGDHMNDYGYIFTEARMGGVE